MTKFIFHGGVTQLDVESNRSFYREIIKDIPEEGTILLVYFASRSTDTESNEEKMKADIERFEEQSEGKGLHFIMATRGEFIEQLSQADGVYIRGGSTAQLMEILRSYPDLKPFIKGKVLAGSSAGAYALLTFYDSHYEDLVLEGLALAPVRVVCHCDSVKMKPREKSVQLLKETAPELELILLNDCEWKVFLS